MQFDKEGVTAIAVAVFGKKYTWWAADHGVENYRYIEGLNNKFTRYKLNSFLYFEDKDSEESRYLTTMALRQLYVEVLESLLASLFSLLESPQAVPIWLAKYTNRSLEICINALERGENIYFPNLERYTNIHRIADSVLYYVKNESSIIDRNNYYSFSSAFSTIIRHAIMNYNNGKLIKEYNSIKHAHRATLGGSELKVSFNAIDPLIRPDESTFRTLVKSDSGITFPNVRTVRRHNQTEELSLEDGSSTVSNSKIALRIDALLRAQEVIYMAMSNRAGVPLKQPLPKMRSSVDERSCWMPEQYEGVLLSNYNYDFSDSDHVTRGWGLNVDITRAISPNQGIGAFTTDDTDLLFQQILTKTFI